MIERPQTKPEKADDSPPPWAASESRLRTAAILLGAFTGLLLAALDQTLVTTALPKIAEELG